MADISKLTRIIAGVARQVDLSTNTLVIDNAKVKLGGANHFTFSGTLTADRSIIVPDANVNLGHIASLVSLSGVSGGSVNLGAFTGTTIPDNQTIKQALQALETAIETVNVSSVLDGTFRIQNTGDNTKQIAFNAAAIAASTTRTITMPDANVDLGKVNTAIQRDGSVAFTANQSMGGFGLTNVSQIEMSNAGGSIIGPNTSGITIAPVSGNTGAFISDSTSYFFGPTSTLGVEPSTIVIAEGAASGVVDIRTEGGANSYLRLNATSGNNGSGRTQIGGISVEVLQEMSMSSNKITNLADPTAAQDAATKSYVDLNLQGVKPKQAARVATTANITLSGLQTIDGISVTAGNRVLVKDQNDPSENGIYVAASGAWSRSSDFDSLTPIDEINGSWVGIQEGTVNAGKVFIQYNEVAVLDTDPIGFTFFTDLSNLTGGDMITVTGGEVSVDLAATSGLESTNPGNANGQLRVKVEATNPSLEINGSNELRVAVDNLGGIKRGGSGLYIDTDNATVEVDTGTGKLQVKDSGITNAKMAASSVGENNIIDDAVTTNKIANSAVTNAKIASNAVDESKIATSVAGNGLTGGGGSPLAVGNSDGSISVSADAISVVSAPLAQKTILAGESYAADTTFVVRLARTGETAGRAYKADNNAATNDNFYVVGLKKAGAAAAASDPIQMVMLGTLILGSNDSAFLAADVGKPVFLTTSGGFSVTAPTAVDTAVVRIGIVEATNAIFVQPSVVGIN